jgi:hypothetical protein
MKWLPYLCALLMIVGCTQEGDLSVTNESGPDLEIALDGSMYLLDDGETLVKTINLGREFIFGPEEELVSVAGEGYCKWDFYELIAMEDQMNSQFTVYGDAGYFDICNETGFAFELYLSPCWAEDWGDPLEIVRDGDCTTWKVEDGCWDMMTVSIETQFEDYDVFVSPCQVAVYDILPAAMTRGKQPVLKLAPAREPAGSGELKKKKTGQRGAR